MRWQGCAVWAILALGTGSLLFQPPPLASTCAAKNSPWLSSTGWAAPSTAQSPHAQPATSLQMLWATTPLAVGVMVNASCVTTFFTTFYTRLQLQLCSGPSKRDASSYQAEMRGQQTCLSPGGQDSALDVTVVSALQNAMVAGSATTDGYALQRALDRKVANAGEACRREGITFNEYP